MKQVFTQVRPYNLKLDLPKGKDGSDKPDYNHSAPTSITLNLLDRYNFSPTHNVTIK